MISTFGIPVLNRGDLLLRCVKSIDHPVDTLFVINNGDDTGVNGIVSMIKNKDLPNSSLFQNVIIEKYKNLGCGPSWNRIMSASPGPWFLSGSDMSYMPGALALADRTLEENPGAEAVLAYHYSAIILTEACKKRIGTFDENFYPAYFEDCDHHRRLMMSGAKDIRVPGFECVHGEPPFWGSSTIHSDRELNRKNGITYGNLRKYYLKKWGGEPGKETYTKPFNRDVPWDYWELDAELRKANSLF